MLFFNRFIGFFGAYIALYFSSMNPQPGDICLFYNARGLARLITWFTRSRFYHVALYTGDDCVIEARPRGVVQRDLRSVGEHDYIIIPAPQNKGAQAIKWA